MHVDVTPGPRRHVQRLVATLSSTGWNALRIPENGDLHRHRQVLVLLTPDHQVRVRLHLYKVGGSSRGRVWERRVEITKTFQTGLHRLRGYQEVVLGYDPDNTAYVGLDSRRLEFGGETGNASTFVQPDGLTNASSERIAVIVYPAPILGGIEHQAYFRGERLSEYLFNSVPIHSGLYVGDGLYSGDHSQVQPHGVLEVPDDEANGNVLILNDESLAPRRGLLSSELIEAFEQGNRDVIRRARLSPEAFEAIRRRCAENGLLGEQYVLEHERRRLRAAGRGGLADTVEWTSQVSVGEGYDIHSFEVDGTDRFIEVKSTLGSGMTFEITNNEWRTATHLRQRYFIYRVVNVRSDNPRHHELRDPVSMEEAKSIQRTADGWIITVV